MNQAIRFRASFLLSQLSRSKTHASISRHAFSSRHFSTTPPPHPSSSTSSSWTRLLTRVLVSGSVVAGGVYVAVDPTAPQRVYETLRNELNERIQFFAAPANEKLLPDPAPNTPRTLVIDLDRTLVHSTYSRATGWRVAKRPGVEAFLAYMANFYEVVVFTSKLNSFADPILDRLDPKAYYITHRLYRAETHYKSGVHIKDLSALNRDLSKVIVIDKDEKNVSMHLENALIIPEWTGDPSDTVLLDLIPFLETIVRQDARDVRDELASFKVGSQGDIASAASQYVSLNAAKQEEVAGVGGLFGRSGPAQPTPVEEEEGPKGAVWDSLGRTGKLFHVRGQNATTD